MEEAAFNVLKKLEASFFRFGWISSDSVG